MSESRHGQHGPRNRDNVRSSGISAQTNAHLRGHRAWRSIESSRCGFVIGDSRSLHRTPARPARPRASGPRGGSLLPRRRRPGRSCFERSVAASGRTLGLVRPRRSVVGPERARPATQPRVTALRRQAGSSDNRQKSAAPRSSEGHKKRRPGQERPGRRPDTEDRRSWRRSPDPRSLESKVSVEGPPCRWPIEKYDPRRQGQGMGTGFGPPGATYRRWETCGERRTSVKGSRVRGLGRAGRR